MGLGKHTSASIRVRLVNNTQWQIDVSINHDDCTADVREYVAIHASRSPPY